MFHNDKVFKVFLKRRVFTLLLQHRKKVFTEIHSGIYYLFILTLKLIFTTVLLKNIFHLRHHLHSETGAADDGYTATPRRSFPVAGDSLLLCWSPFCDTLFFSCFSLSWPTPRFCWRMSSSTLLREAEWVVDFCRVS